MNFKQKLIIKLFEPQKNIFIIFLLLISIGFLGIANKVFAQEENYKVQSSLLFPWGYGKGQIPSPGNGPGLFKFDTNGNLYMYCFDNKQCTILEFDSKGNELARISLGAWTPEKFKLTSDGLFMICGYKNELVSVDKNLTLIKKIQIPKNFEIWKMDYESGVLFPVTDIKNNAKKGSDSYVFDQTKWEKAGKPGTKKDEPQVKERWDGHQTEIVFVPQSQSSGVIIFNGRNKTIRHEKIIGKDKFSNVYIEISYAADPGILEDSTVIKVSSSGEVLSLFELKPNDVVDTFEGGRMIPMDVDANGNIYRLRTSNAGVCIDKLVSDKN